MNPALVLGWALAALFCFGWIAQSVMRERAERRAQDQEMVADSLRGLSNRLLEENSKLRQRMGQQPWNL